jgi:two-component system response regulator HydG
LRYRQAKSRRSEGLEKKNILIIDDDESILSPIAEILRLEGYYVDTAKTGKEAIEKSKMRLYNLAIVDVKLPDMDGLDLLKSLKETNPRMVTIVFSGFRTKDGVTKARNSGAEAYFLKPLNMEKLLETLEEQLKKQ